MLRIFLLICCAASIFCTGQDLYDPNDEDDTVVLWKGLFTKLNTIVLETDKINQKLLDFDKRFEEITKRQEDIVKRLDERHLDCNTRQEDQGHQIKTLVENVNSNSDIMSKLSESAELNKKHLTDIRLETRSRQEEQGNQIIKLVDNVNSISKILNESRLGQQDQGSQIMKLFETAELNTKLLNESNADSNQRQEYQARRTRERQEEQGNQIIKLVDNVNSVSKILNESRLGQQDQGSQIIKLLQAAELNTKLLNESKRQDNQVDIIKAVCNPWITILRRKDGSVNFNRNWNEYKAGFGDPPNGEFFIGLDELHEMTTDSPHELMVLLKDWNNEIATAHYDQFGIGGEDKKYALKVLGSYSGDAGDAFEYNKGAPFSTYDQDYDEFSKNCAVDHGGGWWYKMCTHSSPTGPYRNINDSTQSGITWFHWKKNYNSLKFAEMKIRPKFP